VEQLLKVTLEECETLAGNRMVGWSIGSRVWTA